MRILLLLLTLLPYIQTRVVTCTNGFTLVGNKCWKLFSTSTTRTQATKTCSTFAGNLAMIKSAEENQALADFVGNSTKRVWLGLYCFENEMSKCLWDDVQLGSAQEYNNFAENFPRVEIDNCVFYKARGSWAGQWLSGDCVEEMRSFVCELPTTFEDNCPFNFNGSCYVTSETILDSKIFGTTFSQRICEFECADVVSIHSANENRFIQNFYRDRNESHVYIGGVQNRNDQFMWYDGSATDYLNIDPLERGSGACLKMNLQIGSWTSHSCGDWHYLMCKRPAGIPCDRSKITTKRAVTSNCDTRMMAPGFFSSPNYPERYEVFTNCSYHLETLGAQRIRVTFANIDIEKSADVVRIYDGDSTDSPVLGSFSGNYSEPSHFESSSNTMLVTFISDVNVTFSGFYASFIALT